MKTRFTLLMLIAAGGIPSGLGAQPLAAPSAEAMPNPHGDPTTIQTGLIPDPNLPPGRLVVEVVGAPPAGDGSIPVPKAEVQLVTAFQSVAEGMSQESESRTTGSDGRAMFEDIPTALRYSHSIRVRHDGATYALPAFRASEKHGHQATVQVYPVTADPRDAMVGMRGFIYVTLREGQFNFDVLYRVFNMGQKAWVPQNVVLELPTRREAVDTESGESKGGFEATPQGVKLTGTYPPGQRDVRFTFQVPTGNEESESFVMTLPPHVAEQRVLVESTPNMELSVDGFERPQRAEGPEGNRVLITRKTMRPGEAPLDRMRIELGGLPVSGPGRWVAVALALLVALFGLVAALRQRGRPSVEADDEREEARTLLLEELATVERARTRDEIGPKTYQATRQRLLDALARLETADQLSDQPADRRTASA